MSVLLFFQGMSVFNIAIGIIILSYIGWDKKSNDIHYEDWRRILLLVYSYSIIATYLFAMIWMGKRSIALLFLSPWFLFTIFVLPIMISLVLNAYLYRKTSEKLDISTIASKTLIVFTYIAVILNVLFLLFTMYYNTYIYSLIVSINDITKKSIIFDLVDGKKKSSPQEEKTRHSPSPEIKALLEKAWNPVKKTR